MIGLREQIRRSGHSKNAEDSLREDPRDQQERQSVHILGGRHKLRNRPYVALRSAANKDRHCQMFLLCAVVWTSSTQTSSQIVDAQSGEGDVVRKYRSDSAAVQVHPTQGETDMLPP